MWIKAIRFPKELKTILIKSYFMQKYNDFFNKGYTRGF